MVELVAASATSAGEVVAEETPYRHPGGGFVQLIVSRLPAHRRAVRYDGSLETILGVRQRYEVARLRLPVVHGLIDRRVLVNYRVDPDIMVRRLPQPFRPKLAPDGLAIAGICLIRLANVRPRSVPSVFGLSSENAAHRVAVEWDTPSGVQEGVFIPRRDSSSLVNVVVGGKLFPGVHHHARFDVREHGPDYRIELHSSDGAVHVLVEATLAAAFPPGSAFATLEHASAFFRSGSLGYSATHKQGHFDGLELRSVEWRVEPMEVSAVASTYFENETLFPRGSVHFDCALLMRNVVHEWHARDDLCV